MLADLYYKPNPNLALNISYPFMPIIRDDILLVKHFINLLLNNGHLYFCTFHIYALLGLPVGRHFYSEKNLGSILTLKFINLNQ